MEWGRGRGRDRGCYSCEVNGAERPRIVLPDNASSVASLPGSMDKRILPYVSSGSITESVIESGGVQKIVLSTGDSTSNPASVHQSSPKEIVKQISLVGGAHEQTSEDEDDPASAIASPVDEASSSNPAAEGTGGGQAGGKKKNRRKKRKAHRG
jgi:hypothetical protein